MKFLKLIKFILILSSGLYDETFGDDCASKNQNQMKDSSGNLSTLSKTISVVFKNKSYDSLRYLIQVAGNDEVKNESYVITQKELQETIRYIYQEKLNADDLRKMRTDLLDHKDFQKLSSLQQIDARRVLDDIVYVENRMNEYRNLSNMYCRFALADNPFDEFPKGSIFRSDIALEDLKDGREQILKMNQNRSVCGLCWYKKKDQ